MPRNNTLQDWLRNHDHNEVYGNWLDYCITNNDSTTTLEDYVKAYYPELWKEYTSGSQQ